MINTISDMINMINTTNNTHIGQSSPFVGQSINIVARAIFATLGTVIALMGVAGSGLLMKVIVRRFRRKRQVHDLFLANLAITDLLTLGFWEAFLVRIFMLGNRTAKDQTGCVVHGIFICTFTGASVFSLLAISFNRYLHVCHSQLCKRFFTLSRAVIIIICLWTGAILMAVPLALDIEEGIYKFDPQTHMCYYGHEIFSYTKGIFMTLCIGSIVLIGVWNFSIFQFWKRSKADLKAWKQNGRQGNVLTRRTDKERNSKDIKASPIETGNKIETEEDTVDDSVSCINQTAISMCSKSGDAMESKVHNCQTENFDSDTTRLDNEMENCSHTMQPVDSEETDDGHCTELTIVNSDEELSFRTMEGEQQSEQEKNCQERPESTKTSSSSGILFSRNRKRSTQDIVTVPSIQANPDSRKCLSSSPASSVGKLAPASVVDNVQQQTKRNKAREVAFVRSLVIVWLLTIFSIIPNIIIVLTNSVIKVPPEIVIFGYMCWVSNNSVNWIVYGVMNPSFRRAYRQCRQQLLGLCCK